MTCMTLEIGDPWPFASARGITGGICVKPVWHALITAPQREAKVASQLENAQTEIRYPVTEKVRHPNGRKQVFEVPIVPRIIYARFRYEPMWDVMKERRVIVGVFCRDGQPIALTDDDVAKVMGLPTEAERLEAERMEALQPRPGEMAKIVDGPFKDFFVDVDRVAFGRVWYSTLTGIRGSIAEGKIQRVAQ